VCGLRPGAADIDPVAVGSSYADVYPAYARLKALIAAGDRTVYVCGWIEKEDRSACTTRAGGRRR
jgi:hypothetical protein